MKSRVEFSLGTLAILALGAPVMWLGLTHSESSFGGELIGIGGLLWFIGLLTFGVSVSFYLADAGRLVVRWLARLAQTRANKDDGGQGY